MRMLLNPPKSALGISVGRKNEEDTSLIVDRSRYGETMQLAEELGVAAGAKARNTGRPLYLWNFKNNWNLWLIGLWNLS